MIIRGILIVFITLLTIFLFVMMVTTGKFDFSILNIMTVFIFILFVLGPGWPTEDNKEVIKVDQKEGKVDVKQKLISYFLRLFCTIISLNFVYSLFTGSIYINLFGRNHEQLKRISFDDSPYIFVITFLFSGYVFVKSIIWLWPRLKASLTPPSSGTR